MWLACARIKETKTMARDTHSFVQAWPFMFDPFMVCKKVYVVACIWKPISLKRNRNERQGITQKISV